LDEYVVGEVGRIIGELHAEGGRQVTRFGGDEYQTLLPNLGKEGAFEVADEVRRRAEKYAFEHEGTLANPTPSVGVATHSEDGTTRNDLTHAADETLYNPANVLVRASDEPRPKCIELLVRNPLESVPQLVVGQA
jgi:diguanylate cyclase (GGDEF)-like protein